MAKYTIIIPVYNSLKYLPNCIETIITQNFNNFEIIVSDDNSTDGTKDFLSSLRHPCLRVVNPPKRMTMVENFEFALQYATGEWIMFLGGDDGLQSYFFELIEKLTLIAEKKRLSIIMSSRAYYFWPGCDLLYGDEAVSYKAFINVEIKKSILQSIYSLFGFQTYFELPQMYTNSVFKREVIEEAKKIQNGRMFSTVPPDANLAAIACSLESKYLFSNIPLGWIGTSPGGVLYSMEEVPSEKVKIGNNINYEDCSGNFALRSCSIYYWNALLLTSKLRSPWVNYILKSTFFKYLLFAGVSYEIKQSNNIDYQKREFFFLEALKINELNPKIIKYISIIFPLLNKVFNALKYLKIKFNNNSIVEVKKSWVNDIDLTMSKISSDISYHSELKEYLKC